MLPRFLHTRRWKRHLQSMVALALLPALLLSSVPKLGCLCADGHFESHCPALAQPAVADRSVQCCGAQRCCNQADVQAQSCCAAPPAGSTKSDSAALAGLPSGNCCRPVWQAPSVALKSSRTDDLPEQLEQPLLLVPSLSVPASERQFVTLARGRSGPPIDDLVIAFCRLTI